MDAAVGRLADSLRRTGILSELDFETVCGELTAAGEAVTVERLLDRLTDRGRLSEYQRQHAGVGRFDDLVLGNYTLVSCIGAGGMGEVFKAVHRRMKRLVAIKVLSREKVSSRGRLELFQREIETMAQLSHPNIVTAYDADECARGAYLVMEFVGGSDLSTLVHKRRTLSLRRGVDYIAQAARGLHYAHSQGVVHGDVKPANMLISQDGTVKITDLGLARLLNNSSPLAVSGDRSGIQNSIAGTVSFMPPEQAFQPDEVDHRSDIYSLGCSLYFLLTGRPLFHEEKMLAHLYAHRDQPRPLLRSLRPDAPLTLEAIYQRMVAPIPDDRFCSMAEVVEALEACELPDTVDPSVNTTVLGTAANDSSMLSSNEGPTTWMSASSLALAELSILLVEQSRLQSRVISKQMAELGIQLIQTATTGQDAWNAMLSQCPDVVVSSMHLSDMTGADLVRRIRGHAKLKDTAFVLISSETDHEFLEPVRQSGTAAILPKPFELRALRSALMAAADFSPHAVRAHNLRLTGLQVLIADDSRSARRHARRVIENLGGDRITEAVDGREAIQFLAQEQFHLVVTDWHMPECDGIGLTRHIRQDPRHQHVPVLMITSETDQTCLDDALRAGVSAICPKVFDPQSVAGILNSLLDVGRLCSMS